MRRADSLEKTLTLGGIGGRRRRGRQRMRWREAWRAAIHGVAKSRTRLSDWTELTEPEAVWWRKRAGLVTSSSRTERKNGHENQRAQCRGSLLSGSTALSKRGAAGSKVRETEETRTVDASAASVWRPAWLRPSLPIGWTQPGTSRGNWVGARPAGCEMRVSAGRQIAGLEGRTEDTCRLAGAILSTLENCVLGYGSEGSGTVQSS